VSNYREHFECDYDISDFKGDHLDQNVDEVYVAYSPRLYTVLSRSSFASRARLGEIYPSRCRRRGRPPQPTDARL